MAEINAAYDLVRSAAQHEAAPPRPPRHRGARRQGRLADRPAAARARAGTAGHADARGGRAARHAGLHLGEPARDPRGHRAAAAVAAGRRARGPRALARVSQRGARSPIACAASTRHSPCARSPGGATCSTTCARTLRRRSSATCSNDRVASYRWRVRAADPVPNVELRRNPHGHESVVFTFPYRADIVDAVRAIPGRRFDWQAKEWWAPRADATAAYVQGVIERFPELEVAPDVAEWLARAVKGWVGRVTAARRAGAGWFVLDGIAGDLPDELLAVAEERGDRRWLPFTQEVDDTLLDLPGARLDPRALRCASRLQVGLVPAPATLALVESSASRASSSRSTGPGRRSARSSNCPPPRPRAHDSARPVPAGAARALHPPARRGRRQRTRRRRSRGCGSSTTARSTRSAARARRKASVLACEARLGGELRPFQRAGVGVRAEGAAVVHRRRAGPRQDDRGAGRAGGGDAYPAVVDLPGVVEVELGARTAHWLPHRACTSWSGPARRSRRPISRSSTTRSSTRPASGSRSPGPRR